MRYLRMNGLVLVLLPLVLMSSANAATSGLCEILVFKLNPEDRHSSVQEIRAGLRDEARRGETIELVRRLHSDLRRLWMPEQVFQLEIWFGVRSGIRVDSLEDLLASEMLGAINVDSMVFSLREIEYSLDEAAGDQPVLVPRHTRVLIAEIVKLLERNYEITVSLRSRVLNVTGETGEVEEAFARVVEEAERRSQVAYEERWGKNVIAMGKAGGNSLWSEGLGALLEQSAQGWAEIVEDPQSFPSRAYFVAADIYSERCMLAARRLLTRIDKSREEGPPIEPVLKEKVSLGADLGALRSSVMTASHAAGVRNRLILHNGR